MGTSHAEDPYTGLRLCNRHLIESAAATTATVIVIITSTTKISITISHDVFLYGC